jgi:hypothetical protein
MKRIVRMEVVQTLWNLIVLVEFWLGEIEYNKLGGRRHRMLHTHIHNTTHKGIKSSRAG